MLITAENCFDWSYSLRSDLSVPFILLQNPNREGSQGTQRQQNRRRRGRHWAKSPPCVCGCWWTRLRGYGEGFLQGSSLLWMGQLFSAHSGVPVPAEQPGSAKKDRQSLTTSHTVTMAVLMGGFIQRWPTGSGITVQSIWSNLSFCSFRSPSPWDRIHLHSPLRLARPDQPRLPCGWPQGPQGGVDGLGVPAWMPRKKPADSDMWACWRSTEGELRGAWWSNVARHLWTCEGGGEGQHQAREVKSNGCFYILSVSECNDRCIHTENNGVI